MPEVTKDLLYELLRNVQRRLETVEAEMTEIKQEIASIRLSHLGMCNDLHNIYAVLAREGRRLERIESRIEARAG